MRSMPSVGIRAAQNLTPEKPRQVQVRCINCPAAHLIAAFFSRDSFSDYLEVRHVKTCVIILFVTIYNFGLNFNDSS